MTIKFINKTVLYRNDPRLHKLELEYVTPDAQLCLVNCHHGILGTPKKFYNTLLVLDWNAVRKEEFSNNYDPYQLLIEPTVNTNTSDKRSVYSTLLLN